MEGLPFLLCSLVLLLPLPTTPYARRPLSSKTRCGGVYVEITVSPLVRSKEARVLELSWDYGDAQVGDQLALYDYDPVIKRSNDGPPQPIQRIHGGEPSGGHYGETHQGERHSGSPITDSYGNPIGNLPTNPSYRNPYDNPYGNPYANPYPSLPQDHRVRRSLEDPLAVVRTDGFRSGLRATAIQEKHTPSSQLGYTSRCLGYWVAYERRLPNVNDTEILAVSCLRTRPTWMSSLRRQIGHTRLSSLLIPGTHDSAAHQEEPRNNILDRYTITQDESVLGQLIYGVRYIDLRVGFYPNKDTQWWANHGPVRIYPLHTVLHDIKAFMDNTNEIVILDVQEFPAGFGKDNKVHLKLVHLLETELGELMAVRDVNWDASLEDVWQSRRRLVVAYDKEEVLPASRKLWPSVRQLWGNVQKEEKLNEFVSRIMERPPRGFPWALMAELTPNARLIATSPTGSLRRLAHRINHNVTAWARGPWGRDMNVLAVDFVRSTGIVQAALEQNLRRVGISDCELQNLLESA